MSSRQSRGPAIAGTSSWSAPGRRRRRDRDAAGAGRAAGAVRRPVTLRRRHAVDPRADARRRAAAATVGPARRAWSRRARRRCGAPSSTTARKRSACPSEPSAGVDALYAPRRTVIDALLVDAAQRAGATVEFGTAVTGLHRSSDGRVTGVVLGRRRADAVLALRASNTPRSWSARTAGIRWLPGCPVPTAVRPAAAPAAFCTATGRTFPPTATNGSTAMA